MALSFNLSPEALAAFSHLPAAIERQKQNAGKVPNQRGEYVDPQSILGNATYSWASPKALGQAPGSFNYQDIPYSGNFGVGIANLGVDQSNIISRIDLARQRHRQNDKSGGHQELYKHMKKWGEKYNPGLVEYLETGRLPNTGVSMDTLLQAYDYGARALGQKQQTKETFFENPFVKGALAAATAYFTGNPALGRRVADAADPSTGENYRQKELSNTNYDPTTSRFPTLEEALGIGLDIGTRFPLNPRPTSLSQKDKRQPTKDDAENVTKNVEDVKQASKRKLQKLQAPTYSASKPSETAPLTNLGQYFPKDIYDRSVYESDYEGTDAAGNRIGDVTNPYNLIALAPKDSKTAPPILRSINQFFPREYTERSVTDAALLPDNNIADRARETNLREGFVDPELDKRNSELFKNLLGMGLNMAQNAQPTDPVFLTPPPVGGNRFQYNPYQFGSPQTMPTSYIAKQSLGQMKTPFQYELEQLVRKV